MAGKRWFVDKTDEPGDYDKGRPHQVGSGSKTPDKAAQLRQRMRGQQPKGSSASFSVREGRKR